MDLNKKAKRLTLKFETFREIFLKSDNRCAFPGCNAVIMNSDGLFIGQICHIEAAEEGGPRFNPIMTNEDRRKASNLMLMCYPHIHGRQVHGEAAPHAAGSDLVDLSAQSHARDRGDGPVRRSDAGVQTALWLHHRSARPSRAGLDRRDDEPDDRLDCTPDY